jgi:hypothetical protein
MQPRRYTSVRLAVDNIALILSREADYIRFMNYPHLAAKMILEQKILTKEVK